MKKTKNRREDPFKIKLSSVICHEWTYKQSSTPSPTDIIKSTTPHQQTSRRRTARRPPEHYKEAAEEGGKLLHIN